MDNRLMTSLWLSLWQGLHSNDASPPAVAFTAGERLQSAWPVTELAASSLALAMQAAADLCGNACPLEVNTRLASRWFQRSYFPINRTVASLWDPFAGDYATRDGWIRLHTNAPHHRAAMEQVLGVHDSREALAKTVHGWMKNTLEEAVISAGGCAAEMRSLADWLRHPQGEHVAQEPLIAQRMQPEAAPPAWRCPVSRPLLGIRVLDLTRIIAGPVATRFLAGLGAEILRLDPPGWEEASLEEEITLGKRCARLNLKLKEGRKAFETLLAQADVLVHGFRADALPRLGYDTDALQRLSPGLIDVSLNAWGWSGPWRNRRGFDSLVQMGCGIADYGRGGDVSTPPSPLPVQALDHATGYMMAASVLKGLRQRRRHNIGFTARLSLARTALLLTQRPYPVADRPAGLGADVAGDLNAETEIAARGIGYRLNAPVWLPGTPLIWSRPASPLGSSAPCWSNTSS
ncbi:CoA transferase [Erwinia sp. HDF1-3R]|uniref:CoA transferase n=1 Tax=Erwinia sp. HDF1-3R TaxID=3141543 RepID=UPI0031F52332